ncbi:hypothetical protein ACTHSJ_33750 [Paenibacillus cellulositrophicus]|uniref:hypothetical protein n=1 Tax=Paenibacillus cellulositrophicus TaxID=562959 RepID=UPI003F7DAC56
MYYLSIFDAISNERIYDLADDPYFPTEGGIASWGICRPNYRKSIKIGDKIVFVGYVKETMQYFLRGWIEISEKLNFVDALSRFPTRKNVIIRDVQSVGENYSKKWLRKELLPIVKKLYGNEYPDHLKQINCNGRVFVQNPEDDHHFDNWKCSRIFLCRKNQFYQCLADGKCIKENNFLKMKGYIIGENWRDYNNYKIEWDLVKPAGFDKKLSTPLNQHNVLRITQEQFNEIINNVRKFIEK